MSVLLQLAGVKGLKITLEKTWDIFQQVQLINLSQVLQVVCQEYVNVNEMETNGTF